jgi:recombination protein RecA
VASRATFCVDREDMGLDEALARIDKMCGQGAIMRLGDEPEPIESISTGCIALDRALGIGGIRKGRAVELFGPESSSRVTVARSQ